MPVPSGFVKPSVAFVHSGLEFSSESQLMARYLAACLFLGEYATCHTVCFDSGKAKAMRGPAPRSITVVPPKKSRPVEVQQSVDFQLDAGFDVLKECQVVVVLVDSLDSDALAERLAKTLPKKRNIGVFCLQHGVKNYSALEHALEETGNFSFDGVAGMHVVEDLNTGALKMLSKGGSLVIERLSRDKTDWGNKYINLLSTMDVNILFRKLLTPHTWGMLVLHLFLSTNALCGGTARQHLRSRPARRVCAQMIRESRAVLTAAARKGQWTPDITAGCWLSLAAFEQMLCLPTFLFVPLSWFVFNVTADAGSPTQVDLHARRKTNVSFTLSELVEVAIKQAVPAPALKLVRQEMRKAVSAGDGVPSIDPAELFQQVGSPTASTDDLVSTVAWRVGIFLGLVVLLILIDAAIPREGTEL